MDEEEDPGERGGTNVGDLFMILIHTFQSSKANPFDYLTELQNHVEEAKGSPQPWNYRKACEATDT